MSRSTFAINWLTLRAVVAAIAAIGIGAAAHAADLVHPRGGGAPVPGRITKLEDAGVTITRSANDAVFYRWDQVREVEMERPDPALGRYMELAVSLWRARTRLERYDTDMAEALFERLFERYRGQSSETALLVTEGLLRCRLARAANDLAMIPALETIRIRRALGNAPNVYPTLAPVFDQRTSLCPALPPVWVMSPNLVRLERELASFEAGTDTAVASMAALYRRALQQQLNLRMEGQQRVLAADHPGVAFLRMIVELQSDDAPTRNAARTAMLRNLPAAAAWEQAWMHYFLGVAMASETAAGSHELGLIRLSHLPASYTASQPYLAGMALAKLIQSCETAGDSTAAASLRNELTTKLPQHPVIATLGGQSSTRSRFVSDPSSRNPGPIRDTQ